MISMTALGPSRNSESALCPRAAIVAGVAGARLIPNHLIYAATFLVCLILLGVIFLRGLYLAARASSTILQALYSDEIKSPIIERYKLLLKEPSPENLPEVSSES